MLTLVVGISVAAVAGAVWAVRRRVPDRRAVVAVSVAFGVAVAASVAVGVIIGYTPGVVTGAAASAVWTIGGFVALNRRLRR